MIIGFHLIWTTYGHWFPNDPRGSWSQEVWKPNLRDLAPIDGQRNVVRPAVVGEVQLQGFLDRARSRLKGDVVNLSPAEIAAVGEVFAGIATSIDLSVWACAIMTNHVHIVVQRHGLSYERIVNRLKGQAGQRVRMLRGLPATAVRAERVPIWTEKYWVRYIDSSAKMVQAIAYVKHNLPEDTPQEWGFVK